ncbi:hypothetical protein OPV22_026293 [Ensete ventricosum]|uniref:Uncharacterized protein n=1 Tax=Ensete ventricosum TaxID=4639 RepID=A0AAV8QJN0_ENSVE|nr:hypothetical protein OPV22_026293 [Ensete ventricosum]
MEASEPSGVAAGAGKPTRIETGERSRDPELDGLDLATGSAMTTSGSGIASPWEGIPIRKKLLGGLPSQSWIWMRNRPHGFIELLLFDAKCYRCTHLSGPSSSLNLDPQLDGTGFGLARRVKEFRSSLQRLSSSSSLLFSKRSREDPAPIPFSPIQFSIG